MFYKKIVRNENNWLILLHGLQANHSIYKDILADEHFSKFSILAIDFIGFGKSAKPEESTYDLAEQSKSLIGILNNEKIQNFHIIGHSLGAMIGMILLSQIGSRVLSFVNLEGNMKIEDCGESKKLESLACTEFQNEYYPSLKNELLKSNIASHKIRGEFLNEIPDYVFYKSAKSILDWSKKNVLEKYFLEAKCPCLLLIGEKGSFFSDPKGEHVEKKVIKNSGHFMLLENPNAVIKEICSFHTKNYYE